MDSLNSLQMLSLNLQKRSGSRKRIAKLARETQEAFGRAILLCMQKLSNAGNSLWGSARGIEGGQLYGSTNGDICILCQNNSKRM